MSGVLGSYGTAYLAAWMSPEELADRQAAEVPVRTVVVPERDQFLQGELWMFPGALSRNSAALAAATDPARTVSEKHSALYRSGFVDVNLTLLKLLVEGRRNAPIRITGIRAVVVDRKPVAEGCSLLGPGPQGTGDVASFGFDLDSDDPVARVQAGANPYQDDFLGPPFFATFTTELGRGEQEVYNVIARTFRADVTWNLVVEVVAAGEAGPIAVTVDNGGRPFRTAALAGDGPLASPSLRHYSEFYQYRVDPGIAFERVPELVM